MQKVNYNLVKSINNTILLTIDNILGINYKYYIFLNGTLEINEKIIHEYIQFDEKNLQLNFIQIDFNISREAPIYLMLKDEYLTQNIRTYANKDELEIIKKSEVLYNPQKIKNLIKKSIKVSREDFEKHKDKSIRKISKYFVANNFLPIYISFKYIDKNFDKFYQMKEDEIEDLNRNTKVNEIFNSNLSKDILNKLKSLNSIEELYNIKINQ